MSNNEVVNLKRKATAACMTCPLCNNLFRDATTIKECLHTFCRKCIRKKLSDVAYCPICNTKLGVHPLDSLRPDHNLQEIKAKIFPCKKIKMKELDDIVPSVTLPKRRKEKSLSSLMLSPPRVPEKSEMTRRRSKSITGKSLRGLSIPAQNHVKKREYSTEDLPERMVVDVFTFLNTSGVLTSQPLETEQIQGEEPEIVGTQPLIVPVVPALATPVEEVFVQAEVAQEAALDQTEAADAQEVDHSEESGTDFSVEILRFQEWFKWKTSKVRDQLPLVDQMMDEDNWVLQMTKYEDFSSKIKTDELFEMFKAGVVESKAKGKLPAIDEEAHIEFIQEIQDVDSDEYEISLQRTLGESLQSFNEYGSNLPIEMEVSQIANLGSTSFIPEHSVTEVHTVTAPSQEVVFEKQSEIPVVETTEVSKATESTETPVVVQPVEESIEDVLTEEPVDVLKVSESTDVPVKDDSVKESTDLPAQESIEVPETVAEGVKQTEALDFVEDQVEDLSEDTTALFDEEPINDKYIPGSTKGLTEDVNTTFIRFEQITSDKPKASSSSSPDEVPLKDIASAMLESLNKQQTQLDSFIYNTVHDKQDIVSRLKNLEGLLHASSKTSQSALTQLQTNITECVQIVNSFVHKIDETFAARNQVLKEQMEVQIDAMKTHLDSKLVDLKITHSNHFNDLARSLSKFEQTQDSFSSTFTRFVANAKKGEEATLKIRQDKEVRKEKKRQDAELARIEEEKRKIKDVLTGEIISSFREAFDNGKCGHKDRLTAFLDHLVHQGVGGTAHRTITIRLEAEDIIRSRVSMHGLEQEVDAIENQGGFHANVTKFVAWTFWKWLHPRMFPNEVFNRDYLKHFRRRN